jgi:hypothetical protein
MVIWWSLIFIIKQNKTMGLVGRKKSGRKLNGSKLNVPGQGISSVKPGGDNKINRQGGSDNNANNNTKNKGNS